MNRGSGTELSCAVPVWLCWESPLSHPHGASPASFPPGFAPSAPQHCPLKTLTPAKPRPTSIATQRHSRFPQAFGDSLSPANTAALKSSAVALLWSWFPDPSQLFLSTVFMKHDSKAGGFVGLSHNQGSKLQTKFQAGLCFILSYLPSASFSTINIFSSLVILGLSFISIE